MTGAGAGACIVVGTPVSLEFLITRDQVFLLNLREFPEIFERTVSFHPLVGADPADPTSGGGVVETRLSGCHVLVEARVGSSRGVLGGLGSVAAQVAGMIRVWRFARPGRVRLVRADDPLLLGLLAWLAARWFRCPVLLRINGDYDALHRDTGALAYPRILRSRAVERGLARFLLSRSWVFTQSDFSRNYAIRNGADPRRVGLIRAGPSLHPVHLTSPSSRERPAGTSEPYAVLVARLEPVKRVDHGLLAFARAIGESEWTGCLLVVGEGSIRRDLEELAREKAPGRVRFLGHQPQEEIARLLTGSAAALLPLAGSVLAEAAMAAAPIVTYDLDWHRELLDDSACAFAAADDPEDLARQLVSILHDPDRARAIGAAARESMVRLLSTVDAKQAEGAFLDSILSSGGVTQKGSDC